MVGRLYEGANTRCLVILPQCSIESVVLADSYEQAKAVAFTQGNNVKEAYMADGTKRSDFSTNRRCLMTANGRDGMHSETTVSTNHVVMGIPHG